MACEFMDNAAVKAYRDEFKFCPNRGFRSDIAVTVQDLDLWKIIIRDWWYIDNKGRKRKKNPLGVKAMLDDYERLVRLKDEVQRKDSRVYSEESLPSRNLGRVPKQGMRLLPEGPRGWTR